MEAGARHALDVARRGAGAVVAHLVSGRGSLAKLAPVHAALAAGGLVSQRLITLETADNPLPVDLTAGGKRLPAPDVLVDGAGTRGQRGGRILVEIERALAELTPDLLVVAGDGDAALAGALAGSKLGVPICHVEAGLRSYEDGRPEEQNRRLIDRLSSLLLADSEEAYDNLIREDTADKRVIPIGSTLVDALAENVGRARASALWRRHGAQAGRYVLVALKPSRLDAGAVATLDRLARAIQVLVAFQPPARVPAHPARRLRAVCEPTYRGFLSLVAGAAVVVTDAGGLQVESTALRVRCFTVADATERMTTISAGTNLLLGADPRRLRDVETLLSSRPLPSSLPPLWDGHAGVRAARAIERSLGLGLAVVS